MGAWGNKLFEDDTACDVRDAYVGLLTAGHAGTAATDLLLERWKNSLADADEGPVLWLALAATQHKYGRLEPRVRNRAFEVLDQGLGLDRWREMGARALNSRLKHLQKVRTQLESPQPKEKYVAPPFNDTCSWEAGDVVGYRLASGQLALFGVLGTEQHAKGVSPVCELLDWAGREPPSAESIATLGIRQGAIPPETLLAALAATYAENAANPTLARQRLLADMGLTEPPRDDSGFDLGQIGAVTNVIGRLKQGDREVTAKVMQFARQRQPALAEPVTRFSLRREFKKSEMPTRRVVRLKLRRPDIGPMGEWMVIRWYELDDALRDVFGVE
ncbi:MAG: hypothetical protein ACT4QC_01715 [Planctomycetaceae bacterium]